MLQNHRRTQGLAWTSIGVLVVGLGACVTRLPDVPPEDWEWASHTSVDRGSLCVVVAGDEEEAVAAAMSDPPLPQTFTADTPLLVVHGQCFRIDCERNVEVTLEADGLALTSRAELEAVVPVEGLFCTDVCDMQVTTLELDPLPEGKHTVTFAGDSVVLEIPGTQRACLGAFPFGKNEDVYE